MGTQPRVLATAFPGACLALPTSRQPQPGNVGVREPSRYLLLVLPLSLLSAPQKTMDLSPTAPCPCHPPHLVLQLFHPYRGVMERVALRVPHTWSQPGSSLNGCTL